MSDLKESKNTSKYYSIISCNYLLFWIRYGFWIVCVWVDKSDTDAILGTLLYRVEPISINYALDHRLLISSLMISITIILFCNNFSMNCCFFMGNFTVLNSCMLCSYLERKWLKDKIYISEQKPDIISRVVFISIHFFFFFF